MRHIEYLQLIASANFTVPIGHVTRVMPTFLEGDGPPISIGDFCRIENAPNASSPFSLGRVLSVASAKITIAPLEVYPILPGAKISAVSGIDELILGDGLLGRAIDPLGRPIDGLGALPAKPMTAATEEFVSPLARDSEPHLLETGVKVIDALLTLGKGQRIGIFAASGAGKTTLLTQLLNQIAADRVVICLVGERGREAASLWDKDLKAEVKARSTLVAATADQTAAMRVLCVDHASKIAKAWRDEGLHVLLVLDSATRLAMAMREVGLAAGEPPTLRAYTPSVFAMIPKILEGFGAFKSGGAITGILTVLSETEDVDDPLVEMLKSVLDGHLILSREFADQGRFPPLDPLRSISRFSGSVMEPSHRQAAQVILSSLFSYESSRTLIESGLYAPGSSPDLDNAIRLQPALRGFLAQSNREKVPFDRTCDDLLRLASQAA